MIVRPRNDVGRNRNINFTPNIRLWRCAKTGDVEQAKLALREGADPNIAFGFGHTCLHRAAHFGNQGVAEVLVLAGADSMTVNCPGRGLEVTPMHIARQKGHTRTTQVMVKAAETAGE
jgi:ankyrin repeat protein